MTVTPARYEDIPGVMVIERASFASPWSEKMFAGDLSAPFSRFLVGKDGLGTVIGFMVYWMAGGELHLLNLAILPSERRRGHARTFLEIMCEDGARSGCELAFLEVRPSNLAARALYESMGFKEYYVRRRYYTDNNEDEVVMIRRLCRRGEAEGT